MVRFMFFSLGAQASETARGSIKKIVILPTPKCSASGAFSSTLVCATWPGNRPYNPLLKLPVTSIPAKLSLRGIRPQIPFSSRLKLNPMDYRAQGQRSHADLYSITYQGPDAAGPSPKCPFRESRISRFWSD
jgi:hypothetical protein